MTENDDLSYEQLLRLAYGGEEVAEPTGELNQLSETPIFSDAYLDTVTSAHASTQASIERLIAAGTLSEDYRLPELEKFEEQAVALLPAYTGMSEIETAKEISRPTPTMLFVPNLTGDQWHNVLSAYRPGGDQPAGLEDRLREKINSTFHFTQDGNEPTQEGEHWRLAVINTNDCLFGFSIDWRTLSNLRKRALLSGESPSYQWPNKKLATTISEAAKFTGMDLDKPLDVIDAASPSFDAYCAMQWSRIAQGQNPVTGSDSRVYMQSDTLLGKVYDLSSMQNPQVVSLWSDDNGRINTMCGSVFGLETQAQAPYLRLYMDGPTAIRRAAKVK